jgi:hypothetical protein
MRFLSRDFPGRMINRISIRFALKDNTFARGGDNSGWGKLAGSAQAFYNGTYAVCSGETSTMRDIDLIPSPDRQQRNLSRWLLLALHTLPFALVVFGYPRLAANYPAIFYGNLARLAILAWAGVLLLHLLIVALREVREGIMLARRERERREMYASMQRRHLKGRVTAGGQSAGESSRV